MKGLNALSKIVRKYQSPKGSVENTTKELDISSALSRDAEYLNNVYYLLKKSVMRRGYTVIFGQTTECICEDNVVVLNRKLKLLKRVYSLAHEAGHIITLDRCVDLFGDRVFTGGSHHWPSLEAEVQAWNVADKVMRRVKLYSAEYVKYKHACLRSYYLSRK